MMYKDIYFTIYTFLKGDLISYFYFKEKGIIDKFYDENLLDKEKNKDCGIFDISLLFPPIDKGVLLH